MHLHPEIKSNMDSVVPIEFQSNWYDDLENRLNKGGPWDDWKLFNLASQAESATLVTSFDEMLCLKHLQATSFIRSR